MALADAEESLKENKEFTKGLYMKAEALYATGEFELALVFYHRGKKLRGDVKEFQLGINKAQEAIDNCVGDPHTVKLEVKGDLSYFTKVDEVNTFLLIQIGLRFNLIFCIIIFFLNLLV